MKNLFKELAVKIGNNSNDTYIKGTAKVYGEKRAWEMLEESLKADVANISLVKERMQEKGIGLEEAFAQLLQEPEFFIKYLEQRGTQYIKHISNKGQVMEMPAVSIFTYANEEIGNNIEIAKKAMKERIDLSFIGQELSNNGEFMKEAIISNRSNVRYIGEELKNNKEFLKELIEEAPYVGTDILKYGSEEIKKDEEIIISVASKDVGVLNYISDELKNNYDFASKLLKVVPRAIEYIGEEIKHNPKIISQVVADYGLALRYASEEQRNDPQIVSQAVNNNGAALAYASEELRNNLQIVSQAVNNNGVALKYASEELKNNTQIVSQAVKYDGLLLAYASKELQENYDIAITAMKDDYEAILFISPKLVRNKEFMAEAVRVNPFVLQMDELYASHDKEMLLIGVSALNEMIENRKDEKAYVHLFQQLVEEYSQKINKIELREKANEAKQLNLQKQQKENRNLDESNER